MGSDSFLAVHIKSDNSKELNARANPIDNPTDNIFPLTVKDPDNHSKHTTWNPLEFKSIDDMPILYLEVQVHRSLMENQRLGVKYIERVVIREPEKLGSTETLKLIKELEKRGIPWDVGKSEEDSNKLRQEVKWIEEAFGKTTPT